MSGRSIAGRRAHLERGSRDAWHTERRTRTVAVASCFLSLALGCGPIVMIPGGALSGTPTPIPDDWTFTNEFDTVQLETRPEDPYSVNIWVVESGGSLYIAAGRGSETGWAQNLEGDPRVRLRVGEGLYDLRAVRANDPESRDRFLRAARAKYDFDPEERDTNEAVLYRLVAR